jgi:hypothetical protein
LVGYIDPQASMVRVTESVVFAVPHPPCCIWMPDVYVV